MNWLDDDDDAGLWPRRERGQAGNHIDRDSIKISTYLLFLRSPFYVIINNDLLWTIALSGDAFN